MTTHFMGDNYLSMVLRVLTYIPITVGEIMEKLDIPESRITYVVNALKQGINEGKIISIEDFEGFDITRLTKYSEHLSYWIRNKYALATGKRHFMCSRGDIPSDILDSIHAERKHFPYPL
jgi:hypothetical protein